MSAPMPPCRCWVAWTTRWPPSDAHHLATIAALVASSPSSMRQAAWRLSEGLPATDEVSVAKYWAAEGGHRVVHATQHLHGGMGADIDYPVHRYFLWGKTIEQTLGGPGQQLAALGAELAEAK